MTRRSHVYSLVERNPAQIDQIKSIDKGSGAI